MIETILTKIEQGQRFVVAAHANPDGDAMGSSLALGNALREMGKTVTVYNRDGAPAPFDFLPGAATVVDNLEGMEPFDIGFVLDSGELERAGAFLQGCCSELINLDHHPHAERFGTINLIDEGACATAVLIYRILRQGQIPVSRDVALCIYTAIISDTGSFRYSNSDPEAFRVAGELVELGVEPWEVAGAVYESQHEPRLRLLAKALDTLTLAAGGRCASVSTTLEMMAQTGATASDTDGFVNYPRSLKGVEVALYFREIGPRRFKLGFRSKGRVDVGSLARALGGGGHHNAAGAVLEGTLDEVRSNVLSRLESLLP